MSFIKVLVSRANYYHNHIDCLYYDPETKMCMFDSYTHNCFLECDEEGFCIFNLANDLVCRKGSWLWDE